MRFDFRYLSSKNKRYRTRLVSVANGAEFVVLDIDRREIPTLSGILYLHVHRASRRCYVGITVQYARDRWQGGHAYRMQKLFGSAINHYGWSAFAFHVLAISDSRAGLLEAEKAAIVAAGGFKSKHNFNATPGGDMVAVNDKPVVGIKLSTGEERRFESASAAARELRLRITDGPASVARGERKSTAGWWFRFEDSPAREPPKQWGEAAKKAAVRKRMARRIFAINYESGAKREFEAVSDAAAQLGLKQSGISLVLAGRLRSFGGWWFSDDGDERKMPKSHGAAARREKRDRTVYATNLKTLEQRAFRNCTVADRDLKLHTGATAAVASGERASAGGWWFSYAPDREPPRLTGFGLVAKARSVSIVAIDAQSGKQKHFESAKVAAQELGVHRSGISMVLKGKRTFAGGYRFVRTK